MSQIYTIDNYNYNCGKNCSSKEHGSIITTFLRRRNASDEQVAKLVAKNCKNFARVADYDGFTALHMAAATGRYAIVEWLLNYGAQIEAKVKKLTPLQYALNHGFIHVAVLLIKYGAKTSDYHELFNPFLCLYDKPSLSALSEILVWGSNKNYNLGIGNVDEKAIPQQMDYFNKNNIKLRNFAISTFHSIFVDDRFQIYTAGHGHKGQLGFGEVNTLVQPQLLNLKLDATSVQISISQNHSLICANGQTVYSCGCNSFKQLRQPFDMLNTFKTIKPINKLSTSLICGIIAKDFYSVVYTCSRIFVWGYNAGQYGMPFECSEWDSYAELNTFKNRIISVQSNNAALVCLTKSNLFLTYHEYKQKTIKPPSSEEIKCFAITGGKYKYDDSASDDSLMIILLTEWNELFIWHQNLDAYVRCTLPYFDMTNVSKLLLFNNVMWLVGDQFLYKGIVLGIGLSMSDDNKSKEKPNEDTFLDVQRKPNVLNTRWDIKYSRIPYFDGVVDVAISPEMNSFMVLQEHSSREMSNIKLDLEDISFKSLMIEASESDSIHDVIFHVDDETFVAHKFIVFSRAAGLLEIVQQNAIDKHVYLNYKRLTSKMFELMMKHIYYSHVLTLTDIEEIETSIGPCSAMSNVEIFTIFREYAGKFGLSKFANNINIYSNSSVKQLPKLNRLNYPELSDVNIICANNQILKAHKCVLISRLEYFNVMFNNNWAENNSANFGTIPIEYMETILSFLYDNDAAAIRSKSYTDNYLYNMISICDQYVIDPLRNVFEALIFDNLSIRKCGYALEVAYSYNCKLLREACIEYILRNLTRMLEYRLLEDLDLDILQDVQTKYHTFYFSGFRNSIEMIEDQFLENYIDDFCIDLNYKYVKEVLQPKNKTSQKFTSNVQERRILEREAIDSIKKQFVEPINEVTPKKQVEHFVDIEPTYLDTPKSKAWIKVSAKEELKLKNILASIKASEKVQSEEKADELFETLGNLKSSPIDISPKKSFQHTTEDIDEGASTSHMSPLSLASFTPQITQKLSQKQRKREGSFKFVRNTEADMLELQNNVDLCSLSPGAEHSFASIIKSPQDNTTPDRVKSNFFPKSISPSTSWANNSTADASPLSPESPFSLRKSSRLSKSSPQSTTNFTKILEEERQEKDYFEKLKRKPLALTLIEESAIDGLKKFYNVDNVFDESIKITRVTRTINPRMNFAQWRKDSSLG